MAILSLLQDIPSLVLVASIFASPTLAINSQLVGTWSTKSGKVLTGPAFYNPINDSLIEPSHTGISYAFTSDGFYEESFYRIVPNATSPNCPQTIMQWQHGTFVENDNTSLTLTPFSVDGRQLVSDPCSPSKRSSYIRYSQNETFKTYQVYTDAYYNVQRLDLFQWDGTPVHPLYLAYNPPQMLPTKTLNPTSAATSKSKAKREFSEDEFYPPLNKDVKHVKRGLVIKQRHAESASFIWWFGIGLSLVGGVAYLL